MMWDEEEAMEEDGGDGDDGGEDGEEGEEFEWENLYFQAKGMAFRAHSALITNLGPQMPWKTIPRLQLRTLKKL